MPANEDSKYLDEQLLALLDRYHLAKQRAQASAAPDVQAVLRQAEQDLAEFIYRFVHKELKPSFSRSFPASDLNSPIRYTDMLDNLFVEVLEKRPDAVWKAESTRAIARFVSVALRHDILSALRSLKRREVKEIPFGQPVSQAGQGEEAPSEDEALTDLARNRHDYFRKKYAIDLADALDAMTAWPKRPAPWPEREEALRLRCLDGLKYGEIAVQMEISIEKVRRLVDEALIALRAELGL
jgi:RNA polymerase sigma factor (sigma-70 family)